MKNETCKTLVSFHDPSKTKKYTLWMIKQLEKDPQIEQKYLFEAISFFHENQNRFKQKDIYQYKSIDELAQAIKLLGPSNRFLKKQIKKGGAEKIYENEEYNVYFILTKEASVTYGHQTKWCVSMKEKTHWEAYSEGGHNIYFAIRKKIKNDSHDKIAISVCRTIRQFNSDIINDNLTIYNCLSYDAQDQRISFIPNSNNDDILKSIIKDISKRPMPFLWRLSHSPLQIKEIESTLEKYQYAWKCIASNKHASPDILKNVFYSIHFSLTKDTFEVIFCLSSNINTPQNILSKIYYGYNRDLGVLKCLASNPNTPKDILNELFLIRSYEIQLALANNNNLPQDILITLVQNNNNNYFQRIRCTIAQRSDLTLDIIKIFIQNEKENPSILYELSRNNHLSKDMIRYIFGKGENPDINFGLAENPNTPADILFFLHRNPKSSYEINLKLSQNPNTPKDILEQLAKNTLFYHIRYLAKKNLEERIKLEQTEAAIAKELTNKET